MLPVPKPSTKETALSTRKLNRMAAALARALRMDEVNPLGRETGQSERLRTVTPFRLFLSISTALADGNVESLADLEPPRPRSSAARARIVTSRGGHVARGLFEREGCSSRWVKTLRELSPEVAA